MKDKDIQKELREAYECLVEMSTEDYIKFVEAKSMLKGILIGKGKRTM